MSRKILTLLAVILVMLSGCMFFQTEDSDMITGEIIEIFPEEDNNEVIELGEEDVVVEIEDKPDTSGILVKVEKVEGDLVTLKPEANDPDGDVIEYTFTAPFNEDGEWLTEEGDVGEYVVTVTASDGRLSTSEDVLVIIKPTNRAPVIACEDKLTFQEGDLVEIECDIYDPEESPVEIEYSGWLEGTEFQTGFNDAGEYEVLVSASDGERTNTKTIEIEINNVNRAPEVESLEELNVEETDLVSLEIVASDPDGEELTYEYSEPFDDNGEWQTELGDSGTYDATVIVSDGEGSTQMEFKVIVALKNTVPTLEFIPSIALDEGDSITLPINAYDREGDELTVTISGWMDSETYMTTFDDAGTHTVLVEVSDGKLTASQEVEIMVNDVNRAPVFKIPA